MTTVSKSHRTMKESHIQRQEPSVSLRSLAEEGLLFPYRNQHSWWMWGCMHLIPAQGRQRQLNLQEFKANLVDKSSRIDRAT